MHAKMHTNAPTHTYKPCPQPYMHAAITSYVFIGGGGQNLQYTIRRYTKNTLNVRSGETMSTYCMKVIYAMHKMSAVCPPAPREKRCI